METIIKELNNLRPTAEQVKDKPAFYAFGYVDAINAVIEVVKNNAALRGVMPSRHTFEDRKLLEDYERYLDDRILGKHNSRASKQLIDDYLDNRNNT